MYVFFFLSEVFWIFPLSWIFWNFIMMKIGVCSGHMALPFRFAQFWGNFFCIISLIIFSPPFSWFSFLFPINKIWVLTDQLYHFLIFSHSTYLFLYFLISLISDSSTWILNFWCHLKVKNAGWGKCRFTLVCMEIN